MSTTSAHPLGSVAAAEPRAETHFGLSPFDAHNQALLANVHPLDWVNPRPAARYNLVVIGAGTAGLVTAAGAAGLGAKVALVERHLMGGDCLNVGCVPSKALLRSSRLAAEVRRAAEFGLVSAGGAQIDFAAVMERVRRVRARLSPHDSAERFRSLGVDVFLGSARFTSRDAVEVGDQKLRFARAIIATGARPVLPPIEGLAEAGFLTNETVFNLTARPARLAVIGGGPIGCELAQAFQRLGSQVVLFVKHAQVLDREDPDAAEVVQRALLRDGVRLVFRADLKRVERSEAWTRLHFAASGQSASVDMDEIVVGAGRAPNVEGLGLEVAGVRYDARRGVLVDDRLRTTNSRIFAAGDVCMNWRFTHAADFAARIAIQNALFLGRKKLSALTMPWCTYTDPELAHVGLSQREAQARGLQLDTYVRHFRDVDRAIADGDEEGFVKIHTRRGTDRLVGATIVGRHAGDMLSEITLAMVSGVGLRKLANVIHPYPTLAEAIRQCGDSYNRTRLTPTVRKVFARWLEWVK
jgi:pyruvate/2-oxoglutarate dehydrogenase complex dihydrolipoamide dehydrogenase (E3) component